MDKLRQVSEKMKEKPLLIVKGITTEEETFTLQVNRRGLIVEHFEKGSTPDAKGDAVLSISKKLKVKLAVLSDADLGSNNDKGTFGALDILNRCKGVQFQETWLVHSSVKLQKVMGASPSAGLVLFNDYYGSEIAFYIEWLKFYTGYLCIPAMTGLALFALQYYRGEVDSKWNPLFNIMMCVWGTVFIESWKRRSSELSNVWGVENAEADMDASDIQKQKSEKKKPIDRTMRFAVTVPAILMMMAAVVRIMVYFLEAISMADITYGANSYMRYYPTLAYSVVPIITATIYEKLAVFMNEFEAYPTRIEAESNLILKRFIFQFVNRYCALFYTAFYLQDMERLRSLLLSMLLMNAAINNITELILPCVPVLIDMGKKKITGGEKKLKDPKPNSPTPTSILKSNGSSKNKPYPLGKGGSVNFGEAVTIPDTPDPTGSSSVDPSKAASSDSWNSFVDDEGALPSSASVPSHTHQDPSNPEVTITDYYKEVLKHELDLVPYNLGDDYMEMLVQYGYVTMFVVVFPLGPLLALLNNILEEKVDKYKLSISRRPHYSDRSGIGAWLGCLELINVVSVLTNCFYLCMMSEHLGLIVPDAYEEQITGSIGGKFFAMIILEHFMMIMKFSLAYLIPDVPMWVLERQAEERMNDVTLKNKVKMRELLDMDVYSRNSSMNAEAISGFNENRHTSDAEAGSRQYAINKLSSGKGAGYFYNPQNLSWLFCVPALLTQLEVSPMYYIPVAGLFFSYLQNEKRKSDMHQALGIVSDAEVLKHIRGELPAWITDSDCERAEWINTILQKLWPFISSGVEKVVKEKVQPILDNSTTRVVPSLEFTTISLGSVAPRIISVRTYPSNDVACVRMDMELKWASDMEVVLQVGKTPPLDIELGDIQFSAVLRIELKPLINKLPGFGAINITCMKAPHFDFAVKVGSVDVLNVGPADLSIGAYVRNMIRNIVCNMMLFPKSVCIPLMDDKAMVDELQLPATPKGLLHLNVISGKKLKAADFLTSDPYVS